MSIASLFFCASSNCKHNSHISLSGSPQFLQNFMPHSWHIQTLSTFLPQIPHFISLSKFLRFLNLSFINNLFKSYLCNAKNNWTYKKSKDSKGVDSNNYSNYKEKRMYVVSIFTHYWSYHASY